LELRRVLARQLEESDLPFDPPALDRLESHRDLILAWNAAAKLVSCSDASPSGLDRHYRESLQALEVADRARRIVDLGTGAGFPGLVWACLRPYKEFVLVEAARRKAAFLQEARRRLSLSGVEVVHERIESADRLSRFGADLIASRATGAHRLVLRAAEISGADRIEVVLYPGRDDHQRILERLGGELELVSSEPLVSGAVGRLLVLRRWRPPG
jgi:16S rRNA (guanine527-N7)-methyltransferase